MTEYINYEVWYNLTIIHKLISQLNCGDTVSFWDYFTLCLRRHHGSPTLDNRQRRNPSNHITIRARSEGIIFESGAEPSKSLDEGGGRHGKLFDLALEKFPSRTKVQA